MTDFYGNHLAVAIHLLDTDLIWNFTDNDFNDKDFIFWLNNLMHTVLEENIVSPPHCVWFFKNVFKNFSKMFLMLCSINWANFFAWLSLLLEILVNLCIAIVCWPGCDVINLEIKVIFLIKPFYHMTKKSKQKFRYFENEKSF